MPNTPPALEVGTKIGQYECIQCLGRCSFGDLGVLKFQVDKESVLALGRTLQLRPEWDEDVRQRVGEAAWDSMEIQHDLLVRPADVVFDGDRMLLVCDYVEGQLLRSLLNAKAATSTAFPVDIALRIVVDTLDAVDAIHEGGALLGSESCAGGIAPESLLVSTQGATLVIDALVAGSVATLSGSKYYTAPEQDAGTMSQRSDVFAIGCLLWELLSNRELPSAAKGPTSGAREPVRAVDVKRRPPGEVSPALIEIVERATRAAPESRYRSPKQMLSAIEAAGVKIASRDEVAAFVEFLASALLHNQRQATEDSTIARLSLLFGPKRASDRPAWRKTTQPKNPGRATRAGGLAEAPSTQRSKPAQKTTPAQQAKKPGPAKPAPAAIPRPGKLEPQAVKSIGRPKSAASKPFQPRAKTLLGLNAKVEVALPEPPAVHGAIPAAPAPNAPGEGPLPPLPPLAPPPQQQGPVSMLYLQGGAPPEAAVKSLAVADAMSFDDDLRELSEFVGERYSELDPDPMGEDLTRADVRYDQLMARSRDAGDGQHTVPTPDTGWAAPEAPAPEAAAQHGAAPYPAEQGARPAVPQKPAVRRPHVALWAVGGVALALGFGVTAVKLMWSADATTASAERADPVAVAPTRDEAKVAPAAVASEQPTGVEQAAPTASAEVTPSAEATARADPATTTDPAATEEASATPEATAVPTAADAEEAALADAREQTAPEETETAAKTAPPSTEKPPAPRRHRVTKPRSKRKKKKFVPSGL